MTTLIHHDPAPGAPGPVLKDVDPLGNAVVTGVYGMVDFDPGGRTHVTLRWSSVTPYELDLVTLNPTTANVNTWTIGREQLHNGNDESAGDLTISREGGRVQLMMTPPSGMILLPLDDEWTTRFLGATYDVVAAADEWTRVRFPWPVHCDDPRRPRSGDGPHEPGDTPPPVCPR